MRAAALHLFADAAAALGVVAAGAVILGTGGLMWLDPAVSLAIAAFVIAEGVLLVRHSIDVLLESTPADLSSAELSAAMVETPGVAGVHDLHCWSLSTELRALSAHLLLHGHPTLEEAQAVGDTVKDRLRERFGIAHATLELECEPCIHPDVDSCAFEAPAARSGAAPGPARTPPAAHAGR
jgi:cobalt-zinc-cadmium efflux system protein